MAAPISRKLSNSFEGALAGGGDPATSPLYVFGPFLKLIVIAGVAKITFGASIWLVVFTVVAVSAMYRLVMRWVTDGSGGSGLSEEEFGPWAVKVNAGITFIEYTLTFLVSMAAMVTFMADRLPALNQDIFGIQYRTFVAIILSIITGWLVNRGPKVAARVFGPATAGVLALLWIMILTSIWQRYAPNGILHGVPLVPGINLEAFKPEYLFQYTLGGFARILALMTGIEVFANLVAAYEGDDESKSRKAFGSLVIVMGTTSLTMLIVGPAIAALSDIEHAEKVSVFTQTMDTLLPSPLPMIGTVVGILVLLSASAASAQGLQNLALGLKDRHYVPAILGQRNQFGVANWPVWIEVGIVVLMFLVAGTNEETYLAIYAAGVFILLSMTGWATAKRLIRFIREGQGGKQIVMLIGVVFAAVLSTGATTIIFVERFTEGAWLYIPMIAGLFLFFTYFRRKLGDPSPLMEELGQREQAMWGLGIPPGSADLPDAAMVDFGSTLAAQAAITGTDQLIVPASSWRGEKAEIDKVVVSLDGSEFGEYALPMAQAVCEVTGASLVLVSVIPVKGLLRVLPNSPGGEMESGQAERETYLSQVAGKMQSAGIETEYYVAVGPVAEAINTVTRETDADMLIMSTHGRSGMDRFLIGSVANAVVQLATAPIMLLRPDDEMPPTTLEMDEVLVTLDGSSYSERVLPYAKTLADAIDGEIILLTVPQVPEPEMYGAHYDAVKELRDIAEVNAQRYLDSVAHNLRQDGANVRAIVTGSRPATTIVETAEAEGADLIMLATHGRGGMDRLVVGSVADRVVHHTNCPVFLVPVHERRTPH
ncbi:MAG: universal stress protein [Chloroflexota bacterium]|nr:universal stress protein [Chloroflexota bacterium]